METKDVENLKEILGPMYDVVLQDYIYTNTINLILSIVLTIALIIPAIIYGRKAVAIVKHNQELTTSWGRKDPALEWGVCAVAAGLAFLFAICAVGELVSIQAPAYNMLHDILNKS